MAMASGAGPAAYDAGGANRHPHSASAPVFAPASGAVLLRKPESAMEPARADPGWMVPTLVRPQAERAMPRAWTELQRMLGFSQAGSTMASALSGARPDIRRRRGW